MNNNKSIFALLKSLWSHIELKRKKQFRYLILLVIFAALAEIISLGAVLPFLGVLVKPEQVYYLSEMQPIINTFGISSPSELLLPLTSFFIFMAIFAGGLRLALVWAINATSFATGADIGVKIYRSALHQNYNLHVLRNSSEVINGGIVKAEAIIHLALVPALTIISYSVICCSIFMTLLLVDPLVALGSFGGFGFLYACVILYFRKQTPKESKNIAFHSTQAIRALQEGLGGIREVLMGSHQQTFLKIFKESIIPLRTSQAKVTFIATSPRYIFEALGIVVLASVSYVISRSEGGLMEALPTLGILAISAQKILPVLQGLYNSLTNIKSGIASIEDVLKILDEEHKQNNVNHDHCEIEFKNEISIEGVNFSHNGQEPWILSDVNLKIKKGSKVGIMGATGSGKTTLVDLITALLFPSNGMILVDGQQLKDHNYNSWRKRIAYVHQDIFILDSTIYQNIAFGISEHEIDKNRVEEVAFQANISNVIEDMELSYDTIVGEQGARLSGGQKQRLGIARALYRGVDVLILDEATSALDPITEKEVMERIEQIDEEITLIIIAHNSSILEKCNTFIKIRSGKIDQISSNDLVIST